MTNYNCGHTSKEIIMKNTYRGLELWKQWFETVGANGTKEQCFDCYLSNAVRITKE